MDTGTLGLSSFDPLPPLPPTPDPKSPGRAFAYSLFLPGAGQIYCGEKSRGGWTMAFFLLSAALVILLAPQLGGGNASVELFWGIALRTAIILHAFAFLDAYFTAREKTEGTYALNPYQPRLAAVLNLTTRGFGYWHVGARTRATIAFVSFYVLGQVTQAIREVTALDIIAELVLVAMAIDGYRLAKKENARIRGPEAPPPLPPTPTALHPAIPLGLAALMAVGYVLLLAAGLAFQDIQTIDASLTQINPYPNNGGFSVYNSGTGVKLDIPPQWEVPKPDDDGVLAEAKSLEGNCTVNLIAETALPSTPLQTAMDNILSALRENNEVEIVEAKDTQLSGKDAKETTIVVRSDLAEVDQTIVIARQGWTLYTFLTTAAGPADAPCRQEMIVVRATIVIP